MNSNFNPMSPNIYGTWLIHIMILFSFPKYCSMFHFCSVISSTPLFSSRHAISNIKTLNLLFLSAFSMLSFLFTVSLPFRILPPCTHPVFLHSLLQQLHYSLRCERVLSILKDFLNFDCLHTREYSNIHK